MAKARFHKGDLVRVKVPDSARCRSRRDLERRPTQAEVQEWRDSPRSKGMDDAGETKLPPQAVVRRPEDGETFTVIRGRARSDAGWVKRSGFTRVVDSDGVRWFVRTDVLDDA